MSDSNTNGDLSGEQLEDIDPKFVEFFQELQGTSETLHGDRKDLMKELHSKLQAIRQRIRPEMLALADVYEPQLKSVIRELERLRLDFDDAWDKLYEEYPYYKSRELIFDSENGVFRFGSKPRPHAFVEFLLKPLQEDMGPLGELMDNPDFMEEENEGFDIPEDE